MKVEMVARAMFEADAPKRTAPGSAVPVAFSWDEADPSVQGWYIAAGRRWVAAHNAMQKSPA